MARGQSVTLLVGRKATDLTRVRVTAALGAKIQPVANVWLDLGGATARGGAAVVVIDGPRSTASNAAADVMTISSTVGLVPRTRAAAQ